MLGRDHPMSGSSACRIGWCAGDAPPGCPGLGTGISLCWGGDHQVAVWGHPAWAWQRVSDGPEQTGRGKDWAGPGTSRAGGAKAMAGLPRDA